MFIARAVLCFVEVWYWSITKVSDTGIGSSIRHEDGVLRYRYPHYKRKTVWRSSQIYNGIPITNKAGSF